MLLGLVSMSVLAQQDDSGDALPSESVEVQEVMYVTDKLRLSLYKQPDSNSGIMKLLISGDELDILEKTGPYSKVRTTEGMIGWVKNGFLVSSMTSNLLLEQEVKKNKGLQQQLEKFGDTESLVKDYEDSINRMQADLDALKQQLTQRQTEIQDISEQKRALASQLEAQQSTDQGIDLDEIRNLTIQYWYVIAGVAMILLLLGIQIGKVMIESQVRRRFQGVKVW